MATKKRIKDLIEEPSKPPMCVLIKNASDSEILDEVYARKLEDEIIDSILEVEGPTIDKASDEQIKQEMEYRDLYVDDLRNRLDKIRTLMLTSMPHDEVLRDLIYDYSGKIV